MKKAILSGIAAAVLSASPMARADGGSGGSDDVGDGGANRQVNPSVYEFGGDGGPTYSLTSKWIGEFVQKGQNPLKQIHCGYEQVWIPSSVNPTVLQYRNQVYDPKNLLPIGKMKQIGRDCQIIHYK